MIYGNDAQMSKGSDKRQRKDGFIVEFWQIGDVVKVSAVDPATLTEVSIMGPRSAGEAVLEQTALRKLKYMLRKRQAEPPAGGGRLA